MSSTKSKNNTAKPYTLSINGFGKKQPRHIWQLPPLIRLSDSSKLPFRPIKTKALTESTWSTEANAGDHPHYQSHTLTTEEQEQLDNEPGTSDDAVVFGAGAWAV
jgi:hypothetical protein